MAKETVNVEQLFDGAVTADHYKKWCSQFKKSELKYIEKLVRNFTYFGHKRLQRELTNLYQKICEEVEDIKKVLFVPVGYVVKSGSLISYIFSKENRLPGEQFLPYSELSKIELSKYQAVVILDDYIGTGHQSTSIWNNLEETVNCDPVNTPQYYFATVVGFKNGISAVESNTGFKVKTSFVFSERDLPFHPESTIYETDEERQKAKEIVTKYGKLICPEFPLGYYDNSGLIGFYYSTPNNTLPIFWSTQKNWLPLSSRGDDYRDPEYLVGPSINIPENKTFKGFEESLFDENLIDEFNVDPNITIKLTQELKSTQMLLILVPLIKKLSLDERFINEWLKLVNELKSEVHEKEHKSSAIFIGEDDILNSLEYYLISDEIGIDNTEDIKAFAAQTNGFNDALALDTSGRLRGACTYKEPSANTPFVPTKLLSAIEFSKKNQGLLTIFEGDNRVSVIWNGQRLLTYRKSNWHLSPSNFERLIAKLGKDHDIDQSILKRILTVAVQMSYIGEGGIIAIGDHETILTNSAPLDSKIKLGVSNVQELGVEQLINIISQDGASVISNDGKIIQHMTTLRPPGNIDIKTETGKGTKHQTSQIMSHISNSILIAISVDSNFTVYSKGQKIFRMNG